MMVGLESIVNDLDIHAPESEDDGGERGLVYIDGWGYTPNQVRDFAAWLNNLADLADIAGHG